MMCRWAFCCPSELRAGQSGPCAYPLSEAAQAVWLCRGGGGGACVCIVQHCAWACATSKQPGGIGIEDGSHISSLVSINQTIGESVEKTMVRLCEKPLQHKCCKRPGPVLLGTRPRHQKTWGRSAARPHRRPPIGSPGRCKEDFPGPRDPTTTPAALYPRPFGPTAPGCPHHHRQPRYIGLMVPARACPTGRPHPVL